MGRASLKSSRFLASLIDGFFMLLITVAISIVPSITFFKQLVEGKFISADLFWFIFSIIASFLVWILYLSVPTLIFHGSTLGMRFAHLTFSDSKEGEVHFHKVLFRETAVVFCIVFSMGLSLCADVISISSNREAKTFHDCFSSLKVVANND